MSIASLTDRPRLWSRLLATIAGVTCVLVGLNMYLFVSNQALQREVAARQQFITQSAQIQGIARDIITTLANLAVKNNDEQLKLLLASHGITYSGSPPGGSEGRGK